jgi:hypothetical protein
VIEKSGWFWHILKFAPCHCMAFEWKPRQHKKSKHETFEKCSILFKIKEDSSGTQSSECLMSLTPVPSSGATGQAQRLDKRGRFAKVSTHK